MALQYTLRLYKGSDSATLRQAMDQVAITLGGSITWGQPGSSEEDLRLGHNGAIHTIFLPYQSNDFAFCERVGRFLDLPWLELRIQEGTIWDYALYRGAQCLDTFSVCPQYWEGADVGAETLKQWKGKPNILAEAWGIPVQRIMKYLVNWGCQMDPNLGNFQFLLKGKAYPTDEFEYGNYEQFFDVLSTLGGQEPSEQHTIVLPTANL